MRLALLTVPANALVVRTAASLERGLRARGHEVHALRAHELDGARPASGFERMLIVSLEALARAALPDEELARAVVVPCLQDAPHDADGRLDRLVHAAGGLIVRDELERRLVARAFGAGILTRTIVAGDWPATYAATQPASAADDAALRPLHRERYVAYVRVAGPPDVRERDLARAFALYRRESPASPLALAVAGGAGFPAGDGVVLLPPLSASTRRRLYEGSVAVIDLRDRREEPAAYLEAFAASRPVVADARSRSAVSAVEALEGGIACASIAGWFEAFARLEALSGEDLAAWGRAGAATLPAPDDIAARYERALATVSVREPVAAEAQTRPFDDALRAAGEGYDVRFWDAPASAEMLERLRRPSSPLVLYAADRIGAPDRCALLLRALAAMRSYGVDARLHIAGTFENDAARDEVLAEFAASGLAHAASVAENLRHDEAQAYLRTAHLFVSCAQRIGSASAFLDALAFGIPVIALAGEGVRETLRGAGLIVDAATGPFELGMLMKLAAEDEALREKLAGAGFARIAVTEPIA